MRKVGILGGTFNPPHVGHLIVANEVLHTLGLDEVRLMPTAKPPHKSAPGDATALQRLKMVELAVAGVEGLNASSFEVDCGGVSYTYDTMKKLTELEPDSAFHFIIGGDMIDMLPKWYRIEELVKIVEFVGVNRPGTTGKTELPVTFVDIPQIDLSSTVIRERFAGKGTVEMLIPKVVEVFVRKEGLYGC
ncbi:nicotinate-nucleotide adenylyltransferase [Filibacter tadaridae]|uniref:Probable nicotinate-nucleotide adenylyltransferase n=1 Tax=Filibacter tadaridae TaxID=2483811 RepID=A0A3P5XCI9_9BACL|nr:nicotinate-nucleotide adenylyltransferase [Filibacter tadaridae]VDC32550.1 putative nicotinate-nucleotide adenylyltransferase [Filibacter tadaridae]